MKAVSFQRPAYQYICRQCGNTNYFQPKNPNTLELLFGGKATASKASIPKTSRVYVEACRYCRAENRLSL